MAKTVTEAAAKRIFNALAASGVEIGEVEIKPNGITVKVKDDKPESKKNGLKDWSNCDLEAAESV